MTTYQPNWAPLEAVMVQPGMPAQQPDPDEQPAFNQHDEAVANLLDAKEVGERRWQQFERQQAAQQAQGRAALMQKLRGAVSDVLFTAVDTTQQALLDARRDAAQARQALTTHDAGRPRVASEVSGWAKRRGEIVDELSAYEGIAIDAERTHQAAQGRLNQALGQAWVQGRAAAVAVRAQREAEFGRRMEQMRTALNEAHEQGAKELNKLGEAIAWWDQFQPDGQW